MIMSSAGLSIDASGNGSMDASASGRLLFQIGNFCVCHVTSCYDCAFSFLVFRNGSSNSSGSGNTMVFVLSFDISLSVCR